jgi:hypothetical protein
MKTLEEIIRDLPEDLRQQVQDFAEFLLQKRTRRKGGKLRLTWVGALREYRDQFTSLDLQQRALQWWLEDIRDEVSGGH